MAAAELQKETASASLSKRVWRQLDDNVSICADFPSFAAKEPSRTWLFLPLASKRGPRFVAQSPRLSCLLRGPSREPKSNLRERDHLPCLAARAGFTGNKSVLQCVTAVLS